MRRTISSADTFFQKWIFPPLWIGGFGIGTCAVLLDALHDNRGMPPPDAMKVAFVLVWIVGSGFIIWLSAPLKRVQLDEEVLYVSNYWSEESIPLKEVGRITENRRIRPRTVTIHFLHSSPYGERIVFVPKARLFPFGKHPIVSELQELCRRAQALSEDASEFS